MTNEQRIAEIEREQEMAKALGEAIAFVENDTGTDAYIKALLLGGGVETEFDDATGKVFVRHIPLHEMKEETNDPK